MASNAGAPEHGARQQLDATRRNHAEAQRRLETLLEIAGLASEARARRGRPSGARGSDMRAGPR